MRSFIITLLTCSITMSVISLFYMLLTPLLAKRYSVKVRYYAWLVIVIGLIIPFRPQFNITIAKVTIPSQTIIPFVQTDNRISVEHAVTPSVTQSILWWQIAFIVWSIGVFVFFTYHIVKHYRFMKMVKRWSNIIVDGQSFTIFQSLKTEMGILKPINLCLCSCVGSPMMVGFIKPCIMLPHTNWDKDELYFIFKHELVHFKRKDLCYKILVLIATSIHWFNPIVYLISRMIDALCEMSCDIETVQDTDADTRYHYTETIIRVVKYQSKLKTALSTNFYGGKKGMKNRISSIMDTTSKKIGFIIIFVVLIATVGTGYMFTTNGSSHNQTNYSKGNEISNETRVTFDSMKAWWDTGWADDEFFLVFKAESDTTISEYGIKCWDSHGKEIQYLDGPFSPVNETNYVDGYGFCIHAIQDDGSYSGSLVFGETYYWLGYAIVDGKRYESPTNSFVFSAEGSRFGHLMVENEVLNETRVIFDNMKIGWDTSGTDDKFLLTFSMKSNATISEYGIRGDFNGKEIEYIDEPSRLGNKTNSMNNYDFCIYTIQPDGSHFGSLVIGETYHWHVYVIVNGKEYTSPVYPFVFSTEGSRFGK